jgi:hypothetical protein
MVILSCGKHHAPFLVTSAGCGSLAASKNIASFFLASPSRQLNKRDLLQTKEQFFIEDYNCVLCSEQHLRIEHIWSFSAPLPKLPGSTSVHLFLCKTLTPILTIFLRLKYLLVIPFLWKLSSLDHGKFE